MKFSYKCCNFILFCESIIVCSTLGVSIVDHERQQVDLKKCSLEYIRKLVMESCIRPHSHYRHARHANFITHTGTDINPNPGIRSYQDYKSILSSIPQDLLPMESSIVVRRRPKRIRKRAANKPINDSYFFHYCCIHMDDCENMDCP